jgi:hypothetical protein
MPASATTAAGFSALQFGHRFFRAFGGQSFTFPLIRSDLRGFPK